MTYPPPLIRRYTLLKGKLEKEIERLNVEAVFYKSDVLIKRAKRQIRLLRQSLRLLEDTFSGEDIDLT